MDGDIAAQIIGIIASQLEVDPATITADTDLREMGVDSLKLVEVVMDIEDAFNIEIKENAAEAFEKYDTVGEVIAAVRELVAARA